MKHFVPLTRYPKGDQELILNSLVPGMTDVDKMEVCMTPKFFDNRFGNPMAVVRLSCHAPNPNTICDGERGREFKDWLLLAESGYQLWVDRKYKADFYKELKKFRTIQPAFGEWVSTYGHALVPVTVFTECLQQAGCITIRYKAYGQKLPIMAPYLKREPAQVLHPWAELNEWDIGITFRSPHIFLFKPTVEMLDESDFYPIMTPGGQGYGSVQVNTTYNDIPFKVKIYPRIVHVIKSFNSRLQGETLKTLAGVKKRKAATLAMIQDLYTIPEAEMGGFRIEVSVQAPTLAIARQWVENTPLLNIKHWACPGIEDAKLDILITNKEGLLDNTNWVLNRANVLNVFRGDNNNATPRQKQAMADVLCSLGWNAGRWKPTEWSDKSAWWFGQGAQRPGPAAELSRLDSQTNRILFFLNERYHGPTGALDLFKAMREHHKLKRVPCQKNSDHSYNIRVNGLANAPFRMRCNSEDCQDNMSLGQAYRWFSAQVAMGQVRPSGVRLKQIEVEVADIQVSRTCQNLSPSPC